jgi:hypothetical protein
LQLPQNVAKLVFFCTMCGLLFSCAAKTNISSRLNPDYSSVQIQCLLVVAEFHKLDLQEAFEQKFRGCMESRGVRCVFEHDLFFEPENISDEEYFATLRKEKVDAVLIVIPGSSGYTQTYIPESSSTEEKGSGRVDPYGNFSYRSKSKTSTYGGYNVDKPWANFSAELYDPESGHKVWYATGSTGGNAFAKWKTVVRSMAGKTAKKLRQDGIIP